MEPEGERMGDANSYFSGFMRDSRKPLEEKSVKLTHRREIFTHH
jgi:hypothetical protein